ncbi:MAG: TonB family protein [Bacteroidales bacterium]|nr:TonB family protein [Bacteroidales bacterium]
MTRYLLFAVLGTALFWIAYRLLLRKEHSLRLNRFFLLATLVLSLLLPLVHPRVAVGSPTAIGGGGYLLDLSGLGDTPEASINNQSLISAEVSAPHGVDVWQVLGIIYGVGVALCVLLLGMRYVVLWRKLRKYEFVPDGRFREAVTDKDEPSFSFFRYIVAGRGGMSDTELQLVLKHERLHAAQGHSWDILLVQLVCCLLWFDPFVWLYGRDLREVHEYLADEAVLQQGGEGEYKSYLRLLYCQITGMQYVPIVNSFHFSTIKNRITMMKQPKSRRGWVKALAALPVAALLLFPNCKNQEPAQEQATIPDGRYEVSPFIETYRDGQLVEREFMGIIIPLDSVGEHKEFADSAEAVRFNVNIHETVAKSSRVTAMMNLDDSTVNWYQVAWNDEEDMLDWFNKEDYRFFSLAEYPGGFEAMAAYIAESVVYPEKAKAEGVEGKVYVQFVVDTDGSIAEAAVLHGVGGECDDEALRVVKSMPKWQPATFKGKPVRSKYVMPIYYTLK